MTLREAVLERAKKDEKFRNELVVKLEERAKLLRTQLVALERSLRAVRKT